MERRVRECLVAWWRSSSRGSGMTSPQARHGCTSARDVKDGRFTCVVALISTNKDGDLEGESARGGVGEVGVGMEVDAWSSPLMMMLGFRKERR